jgi:hypothetical protein
MGRLEAVPDSMEDPGFEGPGVRRRLSDPRKFPFTVFGPSMSNVAGFVVPVRFPDQPKKE